MLGIRVCIVSVRVSSVPSNLYVRVHRALIEVKMGFSGALGDGVIIAELQNMKEKLQRAFVSIVWLCGLERMVGLSGGLATE